MNRAWVEIDLDALRGNFRIIRKRVGKRGICVPVKADGYGHGGLAVSNLLAQEGVDILGVASCEEGLELRSDSIRIPILILSPSSIIDIPDILKENLTPSIVDLDYAFQFSREAKRIGKGGKVHVEVETGMGRTGVDWEKAPEFIFSILKLENLEVEGIFTHFASAEEKEKSFTKLQLKRFQEVVRILEEKGCRIPFYHTANSSALLELPESYFNLVRPGLLVYGLYPSLELERTIPVKPVMTFKTRVVQLKNVKKGETISYGRTFKVERDSLIAVLSVGYGDGFFRSLSNRGEILIRGKRAKVVGTVCMDLTMVDVTEIPDVKVGDTAVLFGRDGDEEISAHEVGRWAGTIPYEVLSSIGSRVAKVYLEKRKGTRKREFSRERVQVLRVN